MKFNHKIFGLSLLLLGLLVVSSGCARIYTAPDFTDIRSQHHTLAILPFDVSIDMKKLPKGMTYEMLKDMEKDESYVFQSEIYAYFLRRASQNRYTIRFQDIDETNSRLRRANISFENLRDYTKAEIGEILEVDAVLSGTIHLSKPMSTAAAIATSILLGWGGSTNKADVGVSIHDGMDGNLVWKYNHSYEGGLGSSSQRMVKSLMNDVSRTFPYKNY
ncbi:MAG: hypothetical protein MUP70_09010 [Candidatus Aminicenantes bacterium]|nr:hypothetical protein [Candidatus Aminicenantes bacterium]